MHRPFVAVFFPRSRVRVARRIYLHEIDKGGESEEGLREGGTRREMRKRSDGKMSVWCALMRVTLARASGPLASAGTRKKKKRERRGGREGGRMLFRTAKLNYQIKQQRRYINKIDFARRSSKGKRPARRFASNLVSRNSRFNQVARLKRSLFIFVIINPTYLTQARRQAGEEAAVNLITLSKCASRRSPRRCIN